MLTPQNISVANAFNESFEDMNEYLKYLVKDLEKYKKQADCNAKTLAIKERTFKVNNDFVNNAVALIETQNAMLQQQNVINNKPYEMQQQQQFGTRKRICDIERSAEEMHFETLDRFNELEYLIEQKFKELLPKK